MTMILYDFSVEGITKESFYKFVKLAKDLNLDFECNMTKE